MTPAPAMRKILFALALAFGLLSAAPSRAQVKFDIPTTVQKFVDLASKLGKKVQDIQQEVAAKKEAVLTKMGDLRAQAMAWGGSKLDAAKNAAKEKLKKKSKEQEKKDAETLAEIEDKKEELVRFHEAATAAANAKYEADRKLMEENVGRMREWLQDNGQEEWQGEEKA